MPISTKTIWWIFQYVSVDQGGEFRFFRDIHKTSGWYLHFRKTSDQQNWTPGTISTLTRLRHIMQLLVK